jgi:hypothetical protein
MMRNETPAWKVYAAAFGEDDPDTLRARGTRRNLWALDRLARMLPPVVPSAADALKRRGKDQPENLDRLPEPLLQLMRAWADSGFDLDIRTAYSPMWGDSVEDLCASVRAMPALKGAGLTEREIHTLVFEGYSMPKLGRLLSETGAPLEYALALLDKETPRAAPF